MQKFFAADLQQEIALRVTRAVEIDRLVESRFLPLEMNGSRPVPQRAGGSDRTPTPLRFFCMPFDDLLCDAPRRTEKQKGRISRNSVAPIWTWVGQRLLPFETKIYCRDFKTATAAAEHATGKALATKFWAVAAEAMHGAFASAEGRDTARRMLKDELIFADAEEVALLLGVAPAIISIQETLVRPTRKLTDEHLRVLRAVHDALTRATPEAAPYVSIIAENRLAHRRDAVKLSLENL